MKPLIIILVSLLFLNTCATIFLGPTQSIQLNTTPNGADVYINGQKTSKKTPCIVEVKRRVKSSEFNSRNQYNFTFEKEGYTSATQIKDGSLHWAYIMDWFYYLVPGVVDFAVGATHKYDQFVTATLSEKQIQTIVKKELVYVGNNNQYVFDRNSSVDHNIPQIPQKHEMRFALIIGNEDYASHQLDLNTEVNVDFARNDASAFKEYAINTLGIPESNVIFLLDATSGKMQQAISKMNLIIKNTNGKADVFVYYAGHGLPEETTKTPYLMPVDVNGKYATSGIKLQSLYEKLTEYPSKRITVFIDACFSGGARNQGLIAARGVKIKPKEDNLKGNLVVFSASSGMQSSLPFKPESHGIFTYYLLKKLQETSGKLSYEELSSYLNEKVPLKSILLNDKEQTPKTIVSPSVLTNWKDWKLNE